MSDINGIVSKMKNLNTSSIHESGRWLPTTTTTKTVPSTPHSPKELPSSVYSRWY
jgi:hypothetical protein